MTVRVRQFDGQTVACTLGRMVPEQLIDRLRAVVGVHYVGRREHNPRAVVAHLRMALDPVARRQAIETVLDHILEFVPSVEVIFLDTDRRRVSSRAAWLAL